MVSERYPHLFSPMKIGSTTVPNRIVSTAHVAALAENGKPGSRYVAYNVEKAKGGCGLIITFGSASVHPTSPNADWGGVELYDDSVIPYLQRMADAIHQYGSKIFSQITHRGRRGTMDVGLPPLMAPSPIPERAHRGTPHEMDKEEIQMVVQAYGEAALRVKRGGFDGIEILVGYSHLPAQFLSPFSNRRIDEYGGSLENRMRFILEVIQSVREAVGEEFVVGARVTADEKIEGGLGQEMEKEITKRLAATGKIDYLNVVGASGEYPLSQSEVVPSMFYQSGTWVDYAAAIKKEVDIPVIAVGRILDPLQAEWILAQGQADLVAMTRALIADPHMPNKAKEGRFDDIRPCTGNNQGCVGRVYYGMNVTCIHNPVAGREQELAEIKPATKKKKVVVAGGGPAGLETARVAAERGHQVILFEKRPTLGGQITSYSRAPGREDFGAITLWLEGQVKKLGVEIRLGVEATPELILEQKPDTVVVATGSEPKLPELPGADSAPIVSDEDVLTQKIDWGNKVLIIDEDAHHKGPAIAEMLADQGRNVEIISSLFTVGEDIDGMIKPVIYQRLFSKGVTLSPNTMVKEVQEEQVILANVYSGEERVIEGVTAIIYAGLRKASDELYKALKGEVSELYIVGDAMAPRKIPDAILEGTRVARKI